MEHWESADNGQWFFSFNKNSGNRGEGSAWACIGEEEENSVFCIIVSVLSNFSMRSQLVIAKYWSK